MKRAIPLSLALLLVLAGAAGCAKKKPVTAPAADLEVASAPLTPAAPAPAPAAAAAPADPWSGDLESVNRYAREQGLLGDVYFAYDRADLRAEARDRLAANGRFLKEHPHFVVRVEGHADERGTNDYNLALGQNRAGSARQYVGALGVDEGRLEVVSYGKERPVCTEPSEDCWWQNRRAAFVIVGRTSG
ncbi:MAG TPA: OmpA family protein [Thermoanaerobaculia bacterium]